MFDLEGQVREYKSLMNDIINYGQNPYQMLDDLYLTLYNSNPDKAEKCVELGWGLIDENNSNTLLDTLCQTLLDNDLDKIKTCREIGWKLAEETRPSLSQFLLCYKMYKLAAAVEVVKNETNPD
ncbi:hypothetical protein GOV03_01820 [Candidatus Woesearchaeota archaeon]|nr:hypothetical protein [Candidatus Woesearchaeota archaeon]